MDKNDVKLLLEQIENSVVQVDNGEITFEDLGRQFYEYIYEPNTYALATLLEYMRKE